MSIFNYVPGEEVLTPTEEDKEPTLDQLGERMLKLQNLVGYVDKKFHEAAMQRRPIEEQWLKDWQQFNGELSQEEKEQIAIVKKRNPTAASVYINITKTKTLAAYGQVCEILFGDKRFPLELEPTPEPEGIAEEAFVVPEEFPDADIDIYGYAGDGREIEPGATSSSLLGGLKDKYSKLLGIGRKIVPGMSPDPAQFDQISPAAESAARMTKVIQDQILEQNVKRSVKNAVLECCILGTGCIKRPYSYRDTIHKWEETPDGREYVPDERITPKATYTSVWNVYPLGNPRKAGDSEGFVERHLLTAHGLAMLKKEKHFIKGAIDQILDGNGADTSNKRVPQWWEPMLQETNYDTELWGDYEVKEFTGYIDKGFLDGLEEVDSKKLQAMKDLIRVNIWECQGKIIRILINPFTPQLDDYYLFPYEENPNQIWGKGIPFNMRDSQMIINGTFRMAIDNLKFAGSVMFEANENYLVPNQDMSIYNGKIFYTQGGPPGQSIFPIQTPNVATSNIQLLDKARMLADESTGQPSYSYGQYTTGQTRTASGMSMLLQAASLNIKTVVENIDQYLIEPMGQAYFHWNMQFNDEIKEIHGDLKISAKGLDAVMQKEVQSQRLLSFLQVVGGNQMLIPFLNIEYFLKDLAKATGLDPEKAVNDREKAQLYAEIIGRLGNAVNQTNGSEGQNPEGQGRSGGSEAGVGGISPSDPTGSGGGNIGTGSVPQPREAGFAANTG